MKELPKPLSEWKDINTDYKKFQVEDFGSASDTLVDVGDALYRVERETPSWRERWSSQLKGTEQWPS